MEKLKLLMYIKKKSQKALDGKQQASEAECAPVMGVISGLLPHTLFTRNEG